MCTHAHVRILMHHWIKSRFILQRVNLDVALGAKSRRSDLDGRDSPRFANDSLFPLIIICVI